MREQIEAVVVDEKAGPFVSGEELGKIVCAHYALDPQRVSEVSLVMLPDELAHLIITLYFEHALLAKLQVETSQEQ